MSNRVLALWAAAFLGLTVTGCAGRASSGDVAAVNSEKISRADYDAKLEAGPQGKAVFNQLVQSALIEQYAKDNHVDISDADVTKKEDEIKSKYPPGQFAQILKAQNLTEDDVRRILRQQLVVEKAVSANVKVTDAEIQAYLAKNHATLDTAEQVRARHILVADAGKAAEVESKLKGGAKFEELAKQYSTDPSSKDKGGELGFFAKGQMVPAFQNAAFSQKIGVVGPPIKSPFGFHIIEVEEKKAATVATVANSGEKIKTLLTQQQDQQQIPQFLAGLRSKAKIEIYDDKLKDALPPVPAAAPASGGSSAGASPAAAPSAAASAAAPSAAPSDAPSKAP
ncbi:MAG: peptidylprolyl isomerase [Vulcanimicrobiaceae bacterium]